jgi:hypothetical protein
MKVFPSVWSSNSQKKRVEGCFGVTDDEEWPTPGRTIVVTRCDVWQRTGERTARTWHILSRLGCTNMSRLSGCGLLRGRIIMGEYSLRDRGRKTLEKDKQGVITLLSYGRKRGGSEWCLLLCWRIRCKRRRGGRIYKQINYNMSEANRGGRIDY